MKCEEFHRVLPEFVDGQYTVEQAAHLRSCPACSSVVSDLEYVTQEARLLRASEEPSPRVWNAIEITLRQEGLIRGPQRPLSLVSSASHRWRMAWLVPVAAALLLTAGVVGRYLNTRPREMAKAVAGPATTLTPTVAAMNPDDEQLLDAVTFRSPAMRATYEDNLKTVNAYIRDAEETAQLNPDDQDAQQSVMDAYEQKNMVYEMAYDRSLR